MDLIDQDIIIHLLYFCLEGLSLVCCSSSARMNLNLQGVREDIVNRRKHASRERAGKLDPENTLLFIPLVKLVQDHFALPSETRKTEIVFYNYAILRTIYS